MALRIHNTLTRSLEAFHPLRPGKVGMYVCGMTIYDLCHMGHARMMMAFDVVYRWLCTLGYDVTYVRNITDIDDKIIKAMRQDIGSLGIAKPTHEPRATDYVPQMLGLIDRLEKKGLAYHSATGDVNFAVRKFPGYGKLSGKSLDELRAGERVAVLEGKDDPLDFVMWKAAKADEPDDARYPSPYGPGRPGWHIECSAMSCALLGEPFDIHGGGMDLQFPHHENEIAQSEGASGGTYARYWLHNGFLNVDNEKMSKSLGNFFTIRDVLKRYDGETLRFFMLRTHYRSPFNFSDTHLDDARTALRRLYTALDGLEGGAGPVDWSQPVAASFREAMNEDFNTPLALALLFDLASELNRTRAPQTASLLRSLGATLGILQQAPRAYLQGGSGSTGLAESAIDALIAERHAAKKARNFAEADRIRKQLADHGVELKDSAQGTTWVRA
jgi:cysteinyl-tRNA synthetase